MRADYRVYEQEINLKRTPDMMHVGAKFDNLETTKK